MNKIVFFGLIFLVFFIPLSFAELFNDFTPVILDLSTCNNNGTCDSGEDKCTCVNDCGVCSGSVASEVCQEYSCLTGLCRAQIKYYCCGNNICESGEDFANCDADCAPTKIIVELLEPTDSNVFLRGDEITFKVKVKADGVTARNANVRVRTFAGDIPLYDDGNHSDGKEHDGIYGVSFLVSELTVKAEYASEIYAEKLGVSTTENFVVNVDPSLELDFEVDKNNFVLGEIIYFNGQLKKKGIPISTVITFSALNKGIQVFESKIKSDENGFFSLEQRTSLIYPEGNWILRVSGTDSFGNEGLKEKNVIVSKEAGTIFMDVVFSDYEKFYERGQEIKLLVDILFNKEPVEGAQADALFPDGKEVSLRMISEGKYSLSYLIPFDFPLGEQKILINAGKTIGSVKYGGSSELVVTVDNAKIISVLIEPKKETAALGEELNFKLKFSYENGKPLNNAKVSIKINDKNIFASEKEQGVFYFSYVVDSEDLSEARQLLLNVEASDAFGNSITFTKLFEVTGELTLEYYFRENPLLFLSVIFAFVFIIVVIIVIRKRMDRLSSLRKRKKELEKLKSDLQEKYFNLGAVGNEQYYSLLAQYSSELRDIDSAIESFKKTEGTEGIKESEDEEVFGEKTEKASFDDEELESMFKVKDGKKKTFEIQGDEEIPGLFSMPKDNKKTAEKSQEKTEAKKKKKVDDLWD